MLIDRRKTKKQKKFLSTAKQLSHYHLSVPLVSDIIIECGYEYFLPVSSYSIHTSVPYLASSTFLNHQTWLDGRKTIDGAKRMSRNRENIDFSLLRKSGCKRHGTVPFVSFPITEDLHLLSNTCNLIVNTRCRGEEMTLIVIQKHTLSISSHYSGYCHDYRQYHLPSCGIPARV